MVLRTSLLKELPDMQLPYYVDESRDDLFQISDDNTSDDSEISGDSEINDGDSDVWQLI